MYVDRQPLVTLLTDRNADKYNKLLPRADSPFQTWQVIDHTLTVDENGFPNDISIDRATPVKRFINRLRRSKAANTSAKDKRTVHETDTNKDKGITLQMLTNCCKETIATFSRCKDAYTETWLPIPTHTTPKTPDKSTPASKETLHRSRKTSVKDNYDSLSETTTSSTTPQTSTEDTNLKYVTNKMVGHKGTPIETLDQVRWYGSGAIDDKCKPEWNIPAHFAIYYCLTIKTKPSTKSSRRVGRVLH